MRSRQAIAAGAVLSALTILAAVQCSDDDTPAGPTSPSASELIGSWEFTSVSLAYADSAQYTEAEDAADYILDISANTVYTYSRATSTCFCPETSSYQLQGNRLVGPDFSADSTFPGGRVTGSTTWSLTQGQLVLVTSFTFRQDSSTATASASGTYTETYRQTFEAYTGQWPLTECAVGCDLVLYGLNKGTGALAGIQGRWVRLSTTASLVESGAYTQTPDDNSMFAVFTGDTSFVYELDAGNDCYSVDTSDYALSGSTLTGDNYNYSFQFSGEWGSLQSTIVNQGAGIRLTSRGTEGYEDQSASGTESGSSSYTYTGDAVRTTATVPPSWWPTAICPEDESWFKAQQPSATQRLSALKVRGAEALGKRSVFAGR